MTTKTGEEAGRQRSFSSFEKGEGRYFVEFLSLEKGDEELFKENVLLLLNRLLHR